jgi:hypothetical protein
MFFKSPAGGGEPRWISWQCRDRIGATRLTQGRSAALVGLMEKRFIQALIPKAQ